MGKKNDDCGHRRGSKWTVEQLRCVFENRGFELLESIYVDTKSQMKVRCKQGHISYRTLYNVMNGSDCRECSNMRLSRMYSMGVKEIKKRLLKTHGKEIVFLGVSESHAKQQRRGRFACAKQNCGRVWECPIFSVLGGSGCADCSRKSPLSKEIVNERLINGNKTVRMLGSYVNTSTRTLFNCLVCEHDWEASPASVVGGTGCPKCGGKIPLSKNIVNERLAKAKRSIRMIGKYVRIKNKVLYTCLICDNKWMSSTINIVHNGSGCPRCATSGFQIDKSATMYYLKVVHRGHKYYKIGITNNSVQERYAVLELKKITILKEWKHKKGSTSYNKEQKILKKHSKYRYKGKARILISGNTELFTKDVLGLDK